MAPAGLARRRMRKPKRNCLDPGGQMIMIGYMGANNLTGLECYAQIDRPNRDVDEYYRCNNFVY